MEYLRSIYEISKKILRNIYEISEMEKAYKLALAQLPVWKICTQNMCKKRSKSCKNEIECQKVHKKAIFLTTWKTQKLAQLWKISTGGAAAATTFFHLWWALYFCGVCI